MSQKKLLIIHNKKNIEINQKDISYINLGNGIVNIPNSKKITLTKYRRIYYDKYKKLLIKKLAKKVKESEKIAPFINELEIFNLRNDKNANIDLILNVLIISEIIKSQNFKDIRLITDNVLVKDIFTEAYSFIKIKYVGTHFTKINFVLLKIIKFYIKAFFVVLFIKIFFKNKNIKKNFKEACLSMYPIFFKGNKESFFNNKNKIKFNFLLSDETHLNLSFLKIIKILVEIKNDDLVHIESFMTMKSLIKSFLKSTLYYLISLRLNFKFKLNNLDLSGFYKHSIFLGIINRCKLNIYEESLVKALNKFHIKKFNMYLFEYNFGFFINNLINKKVNNTNVVGYQHGIFSNQLLWLDVLLENKNKFNYLPSEINSLNKYSFADYKSKINSNKIKFNLFNKKKSLLSSQYIQSQKKVFPKSILVLPGTHDVKDIYLAIKEICLSNKNKNIFYLKFHPKNILDIKCTNNLKIIKSIKGKKFSNVLISPTSTLVYDFINLKKNFMVYNIDYKQNLISTKLKKKIKFYYF